MGSRKKYVYVGVPEELIRQVDKLVSLGWRGYRSRAEVVRDAVRRLLEEARAEGLI